jgi:hypothetical protein
MKMMMMMEKIETLEMMSGALSSAVAQSITAGRCRS